MKTKELVEEIHKYRREKMWKVIENRYQAESVEGIDLQLLDTQEMVIKRLNDHERNFFGIKCPGVLHFIINDVPRDGGRIPFSHCQGIILNINDFLVTLLKVLNE